MNGPINGHKDGHKSRMATNFLPTFVFSAHFCFKNDGHKDGHKLRFAQKKWANGHFFEKKWAMWPSICGHKMALFRAKMGI